MEINTNSFPDIWPDLNIADIDVVFDAAGPGKRLVIWLQGCAKRCAGCAHGSYLPMRAARRTTVSDIAAMLERLPELDGISLSGGEPLLQAASLVPLVALVRARGLTTVCYTGYRRQELVGLVAKEFLSWVDILIDGEYRRQLQRGGVYRPSSNQRLYFLSGRIRRSDCETVTETVVDLGRERVVVTGTLPTNVRNVLRDKLRERGIVTKL